jgi:hypothetical protein
MAEIKSTLDLVMERTRHLSMSDEEKSLQQREDFEKRLQGLLQQYLDQTLAVKGLRDRLAALQTELNVSDEQYVLQEVLGRIDPDKGYARWLELLAEMAPGVHGPLQKILAEYAEHLADLLLAGEERELTRLAESCDIRGAAVVPNPLKDPEYARAVADRRSATLAGIDALK